MFELLWLLLPVAAFSGWLSGRRTGKPRRNDGSALHPDYFRGLNYLLNEQPDKAIEVFTRMVEVNSETVETHLALGNLFRRRGEVDRAIRIHQNLIARPSLSREQRGHALLELAEDYMRAGLFDRAESLFGELVELNLHVADALQQLIAIYQQEKEWEKAVSAAVRLQNTAGRRMETVIAQFYCELAEQAAQQNEPGIAHQRLKRALAYDPGCVRASILQGNLERRAGHYKGALKAYQRVRHQDVEYLPEVLGPLQECYRALGKPQAVIPYLRGVQEEYDGVSVLLALSEAVRDLEGEAATTEFLTEELRKRPSVRGLSRLIELNLSGSEADQSRDLHVLRELFQALLKDKPVYVCRQCGFQGKVMHWQCPSCRSWASIKPIKGVEGE